jgi:hypothetical protein
VFFHIYYFTGSVRTVNYTLVVLARKNRLAAIHEILKMGQFWTHKTGGNETLSGFAGLSRYSPADLSANCGQIQSIAL